MLYFLSTPKSRKHERFDELNRVRALAESSHPAWRVEELTEVDVMGRKMPVVAFSMGTTDRSAPTLGLFAGVHGLERVGTHLALTYLEKLSRRMRWDRELRERLERVRIVSIPLINPGGMLLKWRSNPRGVDLMRNAPLDAEIEPSLFVGGQRATNKLPWYRGEEHQPMERESRALVDFVRREMYPSPVSVALDMHS
ncbi:MAG: M14 family zinc carboxypeptidase, partial [Myxococcota bacterium]